MPDALPAASLNSLPDPSLDSLPDGLPDGREAWERAIAEIWAMAGERSDDDVIAAITALAGDRPDGAALYERASAYDYAGQEALAEPLYRAALDAGLDTDRRPRAVIQLASTLRNLGRPQESAELLLADAEAQDDLGDARTAFLALALMDAGRPAEALRYALNALAAHLPQYQRAVRAYADDLASDFGDGQAGDQQTPG